MTCGNKREGERVDDGRGKVVIEIVQKGGISGWDCREVGSMSTKK